jgi:ferredoxin
MIRRIIQIDEEKCNGCGACAAACHEGAIAMVDGKARLMRDDYCDGLGDCLPACPTGAITFVEREAAAYDEAAVLAAKAAKQDKLPCGCPGTVAKAIARKSASQPEMNVPAAACPISRLSQWPVQIKLAAPNAPYFDGAHLLVAADCTAFAYGNFHNEFIKNRICLIGCPKLDNVDYSGKLTAILENNDIKSVTVVRMEVPCCGGIENAVRQALKNSGKWIPWQVITVSIDGKIVE